MIWTMAMAEIKNPTRPIPFDNNVLFRRHSDTLFPRAGAKCDTVLHHPEWKTSFEGEKSRLFHFPSYRIFSLGSRQDFRTFRDQVDAQESPSCRISFSSRGEFMIAREKKGINNFETYNKGQENVSLTLQFRIISLPPFYRSLSCL